MSTTDTAVLIALARGSYSSSQAELVELLGINPTVGAAFEDVWTNGGDYPFNVSSGDCEIVSTDGADNAAGTGARTAVVTGIDTAGFSVSETVILNGLSPVALVNLYRRIFSVRIATCGSQGINAGTITLSHASGAAEARAVIPIGAGKTQMFIFSSSNLIISDLVVSAVPAAGAVVANNVTTFQLQARSGLNTGATLVPWVTVDEFDVTDIQGTVRRAFMPLPPIILLGDLRLRAKCATASMNVSARAICYQPNTASTLSYPYP